MNRWWQWLTGRTDEDEEQESTTPENDIPVPRAKWLVIYQLGAGTRVEKPDWMPWHVYREMLLAKAEIEYGYRVEGRRRIPGRLTETPKALPAPEFKSAVYEPPHRETGPMAKFLDTETFPAVPKPGDVARSWHKKHKTP